MRSPAAHAAGASQTAAHAQRNFRCVCGRPVFFRNSTCLACGTPLGYAPTAGQLLPLAPAKPAADGTPRWRNGLAEPRAGEALFRLCGNRDTACACNWLVEPGDTLAASFVAANGEPLCRCCRLTRTLPDLTLPGNAERWKRIETAKRRLVSSLIGLGLPVEPKRRSGDGGDRADRDDRGLAFDLLQSLPHTAAVTTGHADGAVTIDVEEADDATREERRTKLHEPYRTVLGHLRHEVGHYYWQRLVEGSAWHEPFRTLFGDERADYAAALAKHYDAGPAAGWAASHVSAYATSHPWEDWAETWAHYLHIVDALDTARSFGLDGERVELDFERYDAAALGPTDAAGAGFVELLNNWMELAGVLNEISRSMDLPDFYPFVLSAPAVRKLQFVHRVVQATAAGPGRGDVSHEGRGGGNHEGRGGADHEGRGGAAGGSAIGG